jgi:hypothetical protein
MIVDPADHSVAIFVLSGAAYERTGRSALLDVASADIVNTIDWPTDAAD